MLILYNKGIERDVCSFVNINRSNQDNFQFIEYKNLAYYLIFLIVPSACTMKLANQREV